jgi:anti-sigma regulatory factor (Ser/Thr protein kinase)
MAADGSSERTLPPRAPGARRCSLRAEHLALAALADWCADLAARHQLSRESANAVDLCLSELVTNVIDYAYAEDGVSPILVDANHLDGVLEITLWDAGPAFNPLEREAPAENTDLATVRIGGLGIELVRKFTREVSYARVGDWNRLRFAPVGQ